MGLIERQKGARRFGLPIEFPLNDSQGVLVIHDRRQVPDRRKSKCDLVDLKIVLSKFSDA